MVREGIQIDIPFSQYDVFKDDLLQASGRGYFYRFAGDIIQQDLPVTDCLLTTNKVKDIHAVGGRVKNFPIFCKISEEAYEGNSPFAVWTYEEPIQEEGEPVTSNDEVGNLIENYVTWGEYLTSPRPANEDGFHYVLLSHGSELMCAEDCIYLETLDGYTLIEASEYMSKNSEEI